MKGVGNLVLWLWHADMRFPNQGMIQEPSWSSDHDGFQQAGGMTTKADKEEGYSQLKPGSHRAQDTI